MFKLFKNKKYILVEPDTRPSVKLNSCEIFFSWNPTTFDLQVIDFKSDLINFETGEFPKVWENNELDNEYSKYIDGPDQNKYHAARRFVSYFRNICNNAGILKLTKDSLIKHISLIFNGNEHALKSILRGIEMVMNDTINYKQNKFKQIQELIPLQTPIDDWQVEYKLTDAEFEEVIKNVLK